MVEAALAKGPDEAQAILGPLVAGFGPEQLRQCLAFAREWNTNSRRCHAAQATLQAVLLQHPPEARSHYPPCLPVLESLTVSPGKACAQVHVLRSISEHSDTDVPCWVPNAACLS